MSDLTFLRAQSPQEVLDQLASHGSKAMLVAGGTDVMVARREGQLGDVTHLIDISAIEELKTIRVDGDRIRLGAGVTHAQCEDSALLHKAAPVLAQACSWVGSPQIRNRATVGGNVITAASCADTLPALAALKAKCVLQSTANRREVLLTELVQGANQTARRPDELLIEIHFKTPPTETKQTFIKLIRRNAVAKSRLTVALVARQREDKTVAEVRMVVGSATPGPLVCGEVESLLRGRVPVPDLLIQAGKLVSQEMIFHSGYRWSTEYKQPVVEALAVRALKQVLEV